MKNIVLLCICSIIFVNCKQEIKHQQKKAIVSLKSEFFINGFIDNLNTNKVYLNKIIENSTFVIDSSIVKNNEFIFKGFVEYPERFAISFEGYSTKSILIIENTNFSIKIDGNKLQDPIIDGSELNKKLQEYKLTSKNIFKKIEYLFPQIQKYRLENDAQKLSEISEKMKNIEQEHTNFSYNFILKNSDSYIAPMLLRDQLKTTPIDTIKIIKTFEKFSNSVKLSPDSQIIIHQLNLH
ncbi:DUF4369 domain-containing protein [uncultured Lutibacter sp.]|uniref:DUF4369 domain-containing protein n=1 Tax=uncultured Lutibacter sp. TaxID=437739 RepID=UPI002602B1BC|nr:DUF4369 domain-containing protein [uncultured Lutibacter sp.]